MSRSLESSAPDHSEEPGFEAPDETSGDGSSTSGRDRMAIAGFVCSLCVPVITLMLIPMESLSASSQTAEDAFGFLFLAGAVLWVAGLVLSLMAKNRAPRHHKLAKAGTIISGISPMLFIAVLVFLLILAIDSYLNDFFTMGVPTGGSM